MNYEKAYKKQILENVEQVLSEINGSQMRVKIKNWADKFGYDFEQIKNKIKNDEIFRCVFAKDPAKQNIYQNIAAQIIKSTKGVSEFKVLNSGGAKALYIINGSVFAGKDLTNKNQNAKSIDFRFKYGKFSFFVSHKYTKSAGGAQDNQYKDVQEFLREARDSTLANTIFLAICDGDFYKHKDSKTGDESKLKRLQRLTDNRTTFAISIDELGEFLKKFR